MILIFSERTDSSTNNVIDWIDFYKKDWIRVNENEKLNFRIFRNEIILEINNKSFNFSQIESVWFRRSVLKLVPIKKSLSFLKNYLEEEKFWYEDYLIYKLKEKKNIGITKFHMSVNKLIVNETARKIGLKTPDFYLVNRKDDIPNNKRLITKTINGNSLIYYSQKTVSQLFTKEISSVDAPDNFNTSYLQDYVTKKYELRVFYFKGDIWTTAIFSQTNSKTKIDFRNYDWKNPNRTVPYILPLDIKKKIDELMKCLDLDTGSIDLIVNTDYEYFFLEVNPVGQFGMVSNPCNFKIEKKIAQYLSNEL